MLSALQGREDWASVQTLLTQAGRGTQVLWDIPVRSAF